MRRTIKTALWAFAAVVDPVFVAGAYDFSFAFPLSTEVSASDGATMRRASIPVDDAARNASFEVGDRIAIDFFGERTFSLSLVSSPPHGIAGRSFIAKVDSLPNAAVVRKTRNGFSATVDDHAAGLSYRIYSTRDSVVAEVSAIRLHDGCECGTCSGVVIAPPTQQEPAPESPSRRMMSNLRVAGPPVVDVLVAFDNGARAWVEDEWREGSLEECAEAAVQRMNEVLVNSGLGDTYSYRLAGVTVVDDTAPSVSYVLGRERYGNDAWARVRAAREICGADVVTTLVDLGPTFTGTRGVAYSLWKPSYASTAAFASEAFSACHIRSAFKEYTMVHEVGHNLGAGHSDMNAGYEGRSSQYSEYAVGYHFSNSTGGLFRTVMGYVDGADNRRYAPTPYFSSPALTPEEHDVALGTPTNDNVRVLGETCNAVSQFRTAGAYEVDLGLSGKAGELVWRTTSPYPWESVSATDWTNGVSQVLRGSMRNNNPGTAVLATEVAGPARLFFRHRTAFYYSKTRIAGESYASQYSHFDVFLDETHVVSRPDPVEEWELVSLDIPEGTHELIFSFIQQNAQNGSSEGAWVGDIALYDTAPVAFVPPSSVWDSKTFPQVVARSEASAYGTLALYADGGYDADNNPYVQIAEGGSIVAGTVSVVSGTAESVCALSAGMEGLPESFEGDSYLMFDSGSANVGSATMELFRDNFTYTSGDALLQLDGSAVALFAVGGNCATNGSSIPGNVGITVRGDAQAGSIIGGWTVKHNDASVGGSCAVLVQNLQTNSMALTFLNNYCVPSGVYCGYIVGGGWGDCTVAGDTSVVLAPQGGESGVCAKTIVGGGYGADSVVRGSSSVTIRGGSYSGLIIAGSSGGTVVGDATMVISGGSFHGARLRAGNSSGTKTLRFTDSVDLSGVMEVAGFDVIEIPDGAKVTVTDSSVLAAFVAKGYVTKNSTAPYLVGLDQSVWRTSADGGNLSENWDYSPSSGDDVLFVITADTVITNDVAISVGQMKVLNFGDREATLSFAGSSPLLATSLHVASNVVVKAASGLLSFSNVSGSGTISYSGVKPASGVGWTSSSWTGTVWVNDIPTISNARKDWEPSLYGHAGSRLRFTNVNLYFKLKSGTTSVSWDVPIELKGAGLNICDSYGEQTTFIPTLIGDGRFSTSKDSDYGSCINVLDASRFRGVISFPNQRLVFGSNDTATGRGGQVVVEGGVSLAVASNVTWTANGGWTVNGRIDVYGALSSSAGTAVAGSGEVVYHDGIIPPDASAWWQNASWRGTLAMEDLDGGNATKNFHFEKYGNAGSRIRLKRCRIYYVCNDKATFAGTLVLDGDDALAFGNDGYSDYHTVFGALEGNGSISASSRHWVPYVFNTATNYSGSISIGAGSYDSTMEGRRILFGSIASGSDIPRQSALVAVLVNGKAAIGDGARWFAYNGVDVAGELIVNGDASIACDATKASKGLFVEDGAVFRFGADGAKLTFEEPLVFTNGTANIAFGSDFTLADGLQLMAWGAKPDGDFAVLDSALADGWRVVKRSSGLFLRKLHADRFDIPGTSAFVTKDDEWLDDQNFLLYEESNPGATWVDFLADTGANGYPNWVNYVLGFSTENPDDVLKATVVFVGGQVTVSVAGALSRAKSVAWMRPVAVMYSAEELGEWDGGIRMDGFTVTLPASGDRGFYYVTVEFEDD